VGQGCGDGGLSEVDLRTIYSWCVSQSRGE